MDIRNNEINVPTKVRTIDTPYARKIASGDSTRNLYAFNENLLTVLSVKDVKTIIVSPQKIADMKNTDQLNKLVDEALNKGTPITQDEAVIAQNRKVDALVVKIQKEKGNHIKNQRER